MAVATSDASARVGTGEEIIDSSICVATMTGLPVTSAQPDDAPLDRRHLLRRHFDAKIAARDHDAVATRDDRVEALDRRRLLQLRQHCCTLADQGARFVDVLRPLHEGQRDPVGAEFETEARSARSFSVSGDRGRTRPAR